MSSKVLIGLHLDDKNNIEKVRKAIEMSISNILDIDYFSENLSYSLKGEVRRNSYSLFVTVSKIKVLDLLTWTIDDIDIKDCIGADIVNLSIDAKDFNDNGSAELSLFGESRGYICKTESNLVPVFYYNRPIEVKKLYYYDFNRLRLSILLDKTFNFTVHIDLRPDFNSIGIQYLEINIKTFGKFCCLSDSIEELYLMRLKLDSKDVFGISKLNEELYTFFDSALVYQNIGKDIILPTGLTQVFYRCLNTIDNFSIVFPPSVNYIGVGLHNYPNNSANINYLGTFILHKNSPESLFDTIISNFFDIKSKLDGYTLNNIGSYRKDKINFINNNLVKLEFYG